jgi:hypothetical protein
MNKLILVLTVGIVGCAQPPTRSALNCQSEYILDSSSFFIGGSRSKDEITCKMIQIPIVPKSVPLKVPAELIDKNQK